MTLRNCLFFGNRSCQADLPQPPPPPPFYPQMCAKVFIKLSSDEGSIIYYYNTAQQKGIRLVYYQNKDQGKNRITLFRTQKNRDEFPLDRVTCNIDFDGAKYVRKMVP